MASEPELQREADCQATQEGKRQLHRHRDQGPATRQRNRSLQLPHVRQKS